MKGQSWDISPPRRGINWGREHREQMEEPESSGIEDVGEGPSEVVIHTPISRRTRQQTQTIATIAPLWQGVGNSGPVYVKVPFSVTDLMAWKQAAGVYREDPERVGRVVDTIIRTQNPDWSDLQVILDNLLDDTEKQMEGELFLKIPESRTGEILMIQEKVEEQEIPPEVDFAVIPTVWETDIPGKSKLAAPVKIDLKENVGTVKIKQYPIKPEVRQELKKLIDKFLEYKILEECESEYNTPILPVRKPSGEYRIVQDLRAVNQIAKDIYPVVANPYTLLTALKETHQWFTVLDLKDAFFCIPLEKESRKLFAFEWENPQTGRKMQLTWTRLPQGFKNSPTIFGNQLAKELEIWKQDKPRPEHLLLQYVDDILIATEERSTCIQVTIDLLNFLGLNGYKPKNIHELRAFLGMAGWCRLWIMNYGLIAKPLYEAQKNSSFVWGPKQQMAFIELKHALMSAPALGLPDLTKDFQLFVHERQHLALGVLTQKMGSWKRPVGYFSKQLDTVSKGWPNCLRAVAATVMIIQEARKLTLGKTITVYVPHMVKTVLEQKGGHWLSPSRMMKYQVILTQQDDVILKTTNLVNPAVFLSSIQEEGQLEHDCLAAIEYVYSSREDLKDVPLERPDWELYTDGSSFVEQGVQYAGYAVTTDTTVIEAGALASTTSAQKAELIALIRALELSEKKKVNIWTDSKYAFGVVHVHGALWKERGLLSSQGSNIKHQDEILQLLQAVQKPDQVAIMHCKAHQIGNTKEIVGNNLADRTARKVAKERAFQMALIPSKTVTLPREKPKYSEEDNKLGQLLNAKKNLAGWWVTPKGQVQMGRIKSGTEPGDYWQVDFSELPRQNGYRYILVGVDTFTGWPEAFPCRSTQAKEVVKWLLQEIIPRFGVPIGISSDRGPHFVAEVVQNVSKILGITWDLYIPWRPQSSGKVERMNQTLKRQISKICQETNLKWPQALPLALLRIRVQPKSGTSVSPYELLYGKPYESPEPNPNMHVKGKQDVYNYLLSLGKTLTAIWRAVVWNRPLSLEAPVHDFQPGDYVYVKTWASEPLQERWKGPFQVLLTTFTAIKIAESDAWIHYTRVKKAPSPWKIISRDPKTLTLTMRHV
ncbi:PREDICTED: uncharacterized protein LOC104838433 [Haliaeetus leucocephalus]|uniref:uncharacterized protein LOC104838433 n=1 Tax=Haliaeetus leucocephalus TaxID=52644 RepID=UPI00053CC7FC|nr:PREDICTED: uncharacterized protein LOC104838433 [Haliaeetus leucocephalus]